MGFGLERVEERLLVGQPVGLGLGLGLGLGFSTSSLGSRNSCTAIQIESRRMAISRWLRSTW